MTGPRWSRERARERWNDLGIFVGRPLGIGLAITALWPLLTLTAEWSRYEYPPIAGAVYVASVAIVGWLWWRGPAGIGLVGSIGSGLALGALNVVLTHQLPVGEAAGAALWLHGWGATVPMVLGFARPIEEPVFVLGLLALTNAFSVSRGEQSVAALHDAPLHIAMPIAVTTSGLVLVVALRRSVAGARLNRGRAEALAQREQEAAAVERERGRRHGPWEREIAALLDEVAGGVRSAADIEVGRRGRTLAAELRQRLAEPDDSVLRPLMPASTGVRVSLVDHDVGHLPAAADRIALVELVHGLCADSAAGELHLTLQPDGLPGETTRRALVILAADGLPLPRPGPGATVTRESGSRWFYDFTLDCSERPRPRAVGAPKPPTDGRGGTRHPDVGRGPDVRY